MASRNASKGNCCITSAATTSQTPVVGKTRSPSSSSLEDGITVRNLLGDARFQAAIWGLFLVMTGVMVWHNVVLATWGIGTFPSITRRVELAGERLSKLFNAPLVDADGLPSVLRYAEVPAARLLHIFPAGLWSVIAPLQLSKSFRSKYRRVHRYLGRLFVAMSLSIGIGLVPIAQMDDDRPGLGQASILLCAGYFIGTSLLAVSHARNKRFAEHRVWMLRHVAIGHSVHLQRVLGHATWWILPRTVPGYTDLTQEGYEKRTFIFTVYFFLAAVLCVGAMEVWLHHTSPSDGILGKPNSHTKKAA